MWPSGLILAMTLTLNFQGQIWNLLYLCQKWSNCHETKSKHIDWTLGLKCDHHIWPWPWLFKVKYGICYISTKTGLIATKRKANISNEVQASIATNGFDLGHDLDIWFSRSNVILTIWWPRSGIRIYQMMTGVTSDVGVLWTHLVPITKIRQCHMSYLDNEINTWKDSLCIETKPCISAVKIFSRKGHH